MVRFRGLSSFLGLLIILSGCAQPASAGHTQAANLPSPVAATPVQAMTAAPTVTNTPLPTATVTPEPVPTLPAQVTASVNANRSALRSGPGSMFAVLSTLSFSESVEITGKLAGDEAWVYVTTPHQQTGWMWLSLLTPSAPLQGVPLLSFSEGYSVSGLVVDQNDQPASGIGLALCNGYCYQEQKTETTTGNDGTFVFHFPVDKAEAIHVEITRVACGSPLVDQDCRFTGRFDPPAIRINTFPLSEPLRIIYRP